jgi:hypothetical protein
MDIRTTLDESKCSETSVICLLTPDPRRAERYRDKFMRTWSKERWLDMGMATVTFTVHTDRQGRLIGDV